MVYPDIGCFLNVDQVTALGRLAEVEVADDDIVDLTKADGRADEP